MALRFKKFNSTEYVMTVKNGEVVKEGIGLSFFYNSMNTDILVIPTTVMDTVFAFDDILTSDFQSAYVQGEITYKFTDYPKAAKMLDFSQIENKNENKGKRKEVIEAVNKKLVNLTKINLVRTIAGLDIRTVLKAGDFLVEKLREDLVQNDMVKEFGIQIMSITVLGISAKPETRKALEAAAREQILKEQDDAIYMRRNAAIEQERLVRENELNTEIKVAEKEREKKEKNLETKRIILEQEQAIEKEVMENKIKLEERNKDLVAFEMENERRRAEEKAYGTTILMKAFENVDVNILEALALTGMDPKALIAKAFMEIGDKAERIGNLNVTPDLLKTIAGQ